MTPEVSITRRGSRLHDDSDNGKQQRQNGAVEASVETDESDATPTTEIHRLWSLDDIEGAVMEVLDGLAIGSAGQAMEKVVTRRLFGYVAAWGSAILQEALTSAIAPAGDVGVDSNDSSVLCNTKVLLGRSDLPPESLYPPKKCRVDESYQRRQVPIRAIKRNHYDSEALHNAVKEATRSHAHPASITSSRLTVKSKMRKKHHGGVSSHIEPTGIQPGVPYSTETHDSHHSHASDRHHIVSPRKALATHHPAAIEDPRIQPGGTPPPWDPHFHNNTAGPALQLNLDTESIRQGNSVASAQSRRSPPPLSRSPSSVASSRRRPHPPGSAQHGRVTKTLCFGEKEEEVKVEYAIQKSPPRRTSASMKSVLPEIDGGRITPRPSLPYSAFGVFTGVNEDVSDDVKEPNFDEDPLDQHFHGMTLSPGVKVRAGEESNAGPDLPLFASRMRRSTFVHMDTCTLPTSNSAPSSARTLDRPNQPAAQQPRKGTFLTETAWDLGLPTAARNPVGDQVVAHGQSHYLAASSWAKSDDVSSAEPAASCSCSSSTSLTLFRRTSKVQRPCRSCSNPKAELTRADAMNFTNLVKQRAFHLKPPCLPTSSSPSKRAPGASPRRVTSAPASSPLARRNLLLNKKSIQPNNRELASATRII